MATIPDSKTKAKGQPKRKHVTLREYLDGPVDEFKTELIYGERVVCPRPTEEHQDLGHHLGEMLFRWTRAMGLGKVSYDIDMVLDELKDLVYAPDLLFLTKENMQRRRQGRIYGPADLCIEILSESDRPPIQQRKFSDYERYGVAWYWTIEQDPSQPTLLEYQLVNDRFAFRTEITGDTWFEPGLFPGLQFRLPPLLQGDLKAAVKGKAKKLM
jgi:Uma2 family endonuclease